ncbi:MAG: InlB B-repeat-containing protein [Gaiellaceae bacterium]
MRRLAALLIAGAALWLAPGAFAAGWCGSGESTVDRPDVTTGEQVHAVYVIPGDGADNFPVVANKMADDVASLTNWWISQDATRTPRFDQAAFPAGTCVDVSFLRLPDPSSALQGASNAFERVADALFAGGFGNDHKKYYVYYDGPPVQTNICGTGGGTFSGAPSYAIVWLAGCPTVPTDAVGTHELTHALGAVPAGAPHECPPPNDGHVCDSTADLLYPFTSGQALSQLVLDANRDDYYGFATNGIDIRNSLWLRHLDTPQEALAVSLVGTGTVKSDVPGVECGAACTTLWDQGSSVVLDAVPASGERFVKWTGACGGTFPCGVVLSQPEAVTAVFGPLRIPVRLTTAGRGRVACSPSCAKTLAAGKSLTLRALPAKGWRFVRWSGGCAGTRSTCSPATDFALNVRATFRKR